MHELKTGVVAPLDASSTGTQLRTALSRVGLAREPRVDPVGEVAARIAADCDILCVDEFQVTDIADAMILKIFFEELWRRGVVLFATSNRHPQGEMAFVCLFVCLAVMQVPLAVAWELL